MVDEETGEIADAAFIIAGNVDLEKGQIVDVQTIYVHPGFDSERALNDIAVVQLVEKFGGDRWIALADATAESEHAPVGTRAIAAGWGALFDPRILEPELYSEDRWQAIVEPRELGRAELPVVSRALCKDRYRDASALAATIRGYNSDRNEFEVTDNVICAGGEPGVGVCVGDSGGPLLVQANDRQGYVQIGIASWVRICGQPDYPGVFTRVSKYRDWVAELSSQTAIRAA